MPVGTPLRPIAQYLVPQVGWGEQDMGAGEGQQQMVLGAWLRLKRQAG